jgi:hypothetical protein
MRFLPIVSIIILGCLTGKAQQVVDVNSSEFKAADQRTVENAVNGLILQPYKYVKITDGTPYFNKEYMKARLFDAAGTGYACNAVRLNLMDDEVDFKDATGAEMVATTPVKRIQLTDTTTGKQYLFVTGDQIPEADKEEAKAWLQVLVNDKISLCKKVKKSIHETIPYGTSTTEEDIVTFNTYFVRMNNAFTPARNWQDFVGLFSDRKAAVDDYVHSHKLKGKSDKDYIELVQFYNTVKTT